MPIISTKPGNVANSMQQTNAFQEYDAFPRIAQSISLDGEKRAIERDVKIRRRVDVKITEIRCALLFILSLSFSRRRMYFGI